MRRPGYSFRSILAEAALVHHAGQPSNDLNSVPCIRDRRAATILRSTVMGLLIKHDDCDLALRYEHLVKQYQPLSAIEEWAFPTYARDARPEPGFTLPRSLLLRNTSTEVLREIDCYSDSDLAREFGRRGARTVIGVDRSPVLIAAASSASATEPRVSFREADAGALPVGDESVDLAVANHVFNDLPDVTGPVREVARVLRPGGRLVVLMLHPCFYGHRAERQVIGRSLPVAEYFATRSIEQHFSVDGISSPAPTPTWVRPLEAYTNAVTSSGFTITMLTEPHPSETQLETSTWWRENFPRPLFLLIAARKDG